MSKAASLSSGLVRKGEARPAVLVPEPVIPTPPQGSQSTPAAAESSGVSYYKSLTVKLDRARYEALKQAGMRADKKSQAIFTEALDLWLKTNGAQA